MNIVRTALRATARTPRLRRLMSRGFSKANAFWQAVSNDEMLEIYLRHREFTRLPPEAFVANLEVIQKFAPTEGCVVECGVWRGGMSAGMADLLGPDRTYYLFDSFEGLPEAQTIDGQTAIDWQSKNSVDNCRAEENFAKQAMTHSQASKFFLQKGWFEETVTSFKPDTPIAVLRLDADWYSSTAECLNHLYPHVPKGGLILIDDYFAWDGCSRAVHDYLSANGLSDRIHSVDRMLAYIIKSDETETTAIDPKRRL